MQAQGPGGLKPSCTMRASLATVHAATRDRTESPSRTATARRSPREDRNLTPRRPQVPGRAQARSPLADATTRQRGPAQPRRLLRLGSPTRTALGERPALLVPLRAELRSAGGTLRRERSVFRSVLNVKRARARKDRSAEDSPDLRLLPRSDRRHVVGDQARRVRHLQRRWVRGLGAVAGARDRHQRRPGRRPWSSPATRTQAGTEAVVRLLRRHASSQVTRQISSG